MKRTKVKIILSILIILVVLTMTASSCQPSSDQIVNWVALHTWFFIDSTETAINGFALLGPYGMSAQISVIGAQVHVSLTQMTPEHIFGNTLWYTQQGWARFTYWGLPLAVQEALITEITFSIPLYAEGIWFIPYFEGMLDFGPVVTDV